MIVACGVGEPGFYRFAKELFRLGVLSHAELLGWLALHGAVIGCSEHPITDAEFIRLQLELG